MGAIVPCILSGRVPSGWLADHRGIVCDGARRSRESVLKLVDSAGRADKQLSNCGWPWELSFALRAQGRCHFAIRQNPGLSHVAEIERLKGSFPAEHPTAEVDEDVVFHPACGVFNGVPNTAQTQAPFDEHLLFDGHSLKASC